MKVYIANFGRKDYAWLECRNRSTVATMNSADRIDSSGHYEAGNLQIVCRFANRWKSADKDENFRRLIQLLKQERTQEPLLGEQASEAV